MFGAVIVRQSAGQGVGQRIRSLTHIQASQTSCHAKWHLTAIVTEYICIIVFCSPGTTFVVDANTLTLAQSASKCTIQ